jgi:hypothetical protein
MSFLTIDRPKYNVQQSYVLVISVLSDSVRVIDSK